MDTRRPIFRRLGLCLLLAAAGCAGAARGPAPDADQGVGGLDLAGGCTADKDCAGTFRCDVASGKCVQCTMDVHCAMGFVCVPASKTCQKGCSMAQSCGDAGICVNMACVDCNVDADCKDPKNPRCEPQQHKCTPCLLGSDNCAKGTYCKQEGMNLTCAPGCKDDADCGGGVVPDGGIPDGGMGGLGSKCVMNKCVECKVDTDCERGKICKTGTCAAGCSNIQPCPMGQECCNAMCADLTNDFQNCGGCGKSCMGGWNCCDSKCSNPQNDKENCNGCGNLCQADNGVAGCMLRTCTIAMCNPGWKDCNGNYKDGCEVNVDTNINNCGACSNPCALPNASPKCVNGKCEVAGCNFGFGDCDMMPANGCETLVATDPNNCGVCGVKCNVPHATPKCRLGDCEIGVCDPGWVDCNKDPKDGCEVDITTDPKNCGGCGKVCPAINGMAGCVAQLCTNKCAAPYAECNNNPADGCETNTNTDVNHCGGCGKKCATTANVSSVACGAGKCGIGACNTGYFDLINGYADGCECKADGGSSACNTATSLGTIDVGKSTTFTGNLVPGGNENWFQVAFTGNTNKAYHPKIELTTNPGTNFRLEVYQACGQALLPCGGGGAASDRTAWEVKYTGGDPASAFNPIPAVGSGGTVRVRVYRKQGAVTCDNFVLTVSN